MVSSPYTDKHYTGDQTVYYLLGTISIWNLELSPISPNCANFDSRNNNKGTKSQPDFAPSLAPWMPTSASLPTLLCTHLRLLGIPALRRKKAATHWWKGSGRGSRADTGTRPRWPVTKDTPSHSDPPSAIFTEINSFLQSVKHSPSFSAGWATELVALQKKWPVDNEKSPSKE